MQATTRIEQNKSNTRVKKTKIEQKKKMKIIPSSMHKRKCKSGFESTKRNEVCSCKCYYCSERKDKCSYAH